jgi:anaerobic magnesium-protoporphyrin IX monomethyl ester cyclase
VKVLFVQLRFESNMAAMILSSILEQEGFKTEVIIIEGEPQYLDKVRSEIRPDIIAFPCTTVDVKKLRQINWELKSTYDFFSIFGGPHPTFFPELLEEEPYIDAICVGEGEYPLVELARRLMTGQELYSIPNLHVRKDGRIIKNNLLPLIEDLDSLPFMNKHIYDKYYSNNYLLRNVPIRFLSSRGCPYKCTYCFNHKFFELYGIKGKVIRKRSVDNLIEELKEIKKEFSIPMVSFVDDIFCVSKEWVKEFSIKYRSQIGLPYSINTRPNTITKDIARLLSESGCYYATFSIESGDEYLRNKVLKRNMSSDEIIQAANLLHKYDIYFSTGNMLGIPGETWETLRKTVEINRKCAPHYAWASLFQPFPKLALTEYAMANGYFDGNFENIGDDQFTDTPLELSDKKKIIRFHKLFALLVRYPFLNPLVNIMVNLPFDRFYNWLFKSYKIRFNNPIINANKRELKAQSAESFIKMVGYFLKDTLAHLINMINKKIKPTTSC